MCPVGSTGLIIIANEEIEVRRGKGHPEHIIVCSAEMEDKNSMQECGLATKALTSQASFLFDRTRECHPAGKSAAGEANNFN